MLIVLVSHVSHPPHHLINRIVRLDTALIKKNFPVYKN